jgi:SAM-dependent methyltransferase
VIGASDKPWNSASTLYLARKLEELAAGRRLAVLDVGCGDGLVMEQLLEYGHDYSGYDLVRYVDEDEAGRRARLGPHFGASYDEHIKVIRSERDIPFPDASFDVVYANQVFEHVKFLDRMFAECARVLRPGGTLLTNFPLATYLMEGHLPAPIAHWFPPGPLRVRYLHLLSALGVMPRLPGRTARQTAVSQDRYLRDETYYRFLNEVTNVGREHFATFDIDTGAWVTAKIDLLRSLGGTRRTAMARALATLAGPSLDAAVTHLFNAAFVLTEPHRPPA